MQRKLFFVLFFISLTFIIGSTKNSKAQNTSIDLSYHQYLPFIIDTEKVEMVGPSGGNIENLVIDKTDPNIMYVGNWGSGVYKTTDGGVNWFIASNGITNPFIFALALDPVNHETIYAGTYGAGIYKSTDGGAHWTQTSNGLYMPSVVYVITIDKNNPNVIYAGTRNRDSGTFGFLGDYNSYGGGIFKSTDAGANWTHANIPGNDDYVYDIEIDPNDSNIVFAAMHWTGVFKSENAGASWDPKNSGLVHADSLRTRGIEINPNNSNYLYLGTWGTGCFYFSSNGGDTWEVRKSGLGGDDTKVYEITMDPKSPYTVYASTLDYGLFKTTDGGLHWNSAGYLSSFHVTLVIHPSNSQVIFAGVKLTGLWKSINGGGSWVTSHNGIQANNIVSALNDPNNPETIYVSAYGNGLWKSIDNGHNWFSINNGLPDTYISTIVFRPGDPNTLYAGVRNNGIYISTNGGASWTSRNSGIPMISASEILPSLIPIYDHPTSMLWYQEAQEDFVIESSELTQLDDKRASYYPTVNTISISTTNPSIMLIGTAGKGILKSSNGGASWSSTTFGAHTLFSSLLDPTNQKAYMGTGYPNALARTIDPTLYNWLLSNSGLQYQKVASLIFGNSGTNVIFAGTIDDPLADTNEVTGVFKSTDYGSSWSRSGLVDFQVTSLLKFPLNPNWILAGTTDGLFISKDEGISWNLYNASIWNQTSSCLSSGYGDNLILMGTDGGNLMLIKR
jgi:photosystem II stability/assembly factor-like uncharacterized protein